MPVKRMYKMPMKKQRSVAGQARKPAGATKMNPMGKRPSAVPRNWRPVGKPKKKR